MKVKELKEILENLDDELEVGYSYACTKDSFHEMVRASGVYYIVSYIHEDNKVFLTNCYYPRI